MNSEITTRQSTYWDFKSPSGLGRVHFVGKEEFCFYRAATPGFSIHVEHPLLLNYQLSWNRVYISGKPEESSTVLREIGNVWEPLLQGWRSPLLYMNDVGPETMLSEGHGQLLDAPEPLAALAVEVLAKHGIRSTVCSGYGHLKALKVLVAGRNFVIAKDFRIEKHEA